MNLRVFTREQLRQALGDAARKLAFVKDTVKNIPEPHIPFPRLHEIEFLEGRIRAYRAELALRWAQGMSVRIFYSYSRREESLLAELDHSLLSLKSEGMIETFWDRHIDAGLDWQTEISEALSDSDIILLLVSPAFFVSRYCLEVELPAALDLHHYGLARVAPVLLQSCEWQGTALAHLQVIPRDCRPITDWPDRTAAWGEVVNSIHAVVAQLRQFSI